MKYPILTASKQAIRGKTVMLGMGSETNFWAQKAEKFGANLTAFFRVSSHPLVMALSPASRDQSREPHSYEKIDFFSLSCGVIRLGFSRAYVRLRRHTHARKHG
jgi:hypothetical protein